MCLFGVKAPTLLLKLRDQSFFPPLLRMALSFKDVAGKETTLGYGTALTSPVVGAGVGVGVGVESVTYARALDYSKLEASSSARTDMMVLNPS